MDWQCPSCGTQMPLTSQLCTACHQALVHGVDFRAYILERTGHFMARGWLLQRVGAWLKDPAGSRFFVITGEPGSGKTAIAAQLYRFAQGQTPPPDDLEGLHAGFLSAAHFCSARDRRWISPQTFAESVALQLAARYPAFTKALVEKSSNGRLMVQVEQQVDQNTGQIIGVYINNLDLSGIIPEDAFMRAVREPLEALFAQNANEHVVILVDALDEALLYSGPVKIPHLLLAAEHLPSGVQFILTSRPNNAVLDKLRRLQPVEVSLSEGDGLLHSQQDMGDYIRQAFRANPKLRLAPDLSIAAFAQEMQTRQEVNFLYMHYLLQMLEEQGVPVGLADLKALPAGLNAIYLEFLERLAEPQDDVWQKRYSPIVGTFAVAQEALSDLHLAGIIGLAADEIGPVLAPLNQFLDVSGSGGYALYHRSFAEFLLSPEVVRDAKRERNKYWCVAARQHQRIAEWYLKTQPAKWPPYAVQYGFRHLATHLVQAIQGWDDAYPADPSGRSRLAHRLVGLVTEPEFQVLHQHAVDDLPGLRHDLEATLETSLQLLAQDDELQSLPLLVQSALGLIIFSRKWLQPKPLFDLAREGKIEEAERRLTLFTPDIDWYQVAMLALSWLAVDKNPEQARALRDKVAPHLLPQDPLPLMQRRVDAALAQQPQSVSDVPRLSKHPSPAEMRAILQRLGGADVDPELIQSFLGPPPSGELLSRVDYLAQEDGEKLVAYALDHREEPQEADRYLRQYLDLHTSYIYEHYRNRSLWILLRWVLCHPNQHWTRHWVTELAQTALTGSSPQFQEALGLTVLALQTQAHIVGAVDQMDTLQDHVKAAAEAAVCAAESSEIRGQGDSWGYVRRRLAALTQAYGGLLGQPVQELIDLALRPLGGFAGFQAQALLALPEAIQIAMPGATTFIDRALESARATAHNIQDAHFCAISTARVNAMRRRWWPGPPEWTSVLQRFLAEPAAPEFAALHVVGEPYHERKPGLHKLEIPPEIRHADTLKAVARVYQRTALIRAYQRPLEAFQCLNPGWDVDEPLPLGTEINVPDPGFSTALAARIAAGLLSDATLAQREQVQLIRALVPLAVMNPTALDIVLARFLLAARPNDPSQLETLARLAPPVLAPESSTSTSLGPT